MNIIGYALFITFWSLQPDGGVKTENATSNVYTLEDCLDLQKEVPGIMAMEPVIHGSVSQCKPITSD